MSEIGKPRRLVEGRHKVLGAVRYGTDQSVPGMLHARLVTSPHAHARIDSIDTSAALAAPGVVAVLTAADLPNIPANSRRTLLLARDRAIFSGHPVALVIADSEATAEDGRDLVWVEYTPLDACTDLDTALREDAVPVWPDGLPGASEEAAAHGAVAGAAEDSSQSRPPNLAGDTPFLRGDLSQGEAQAAAIVERTYRTAGVHQGYLEPHATLADPDPVTGGATIYSCTQASFDMRQEVARILEVAETDVTVVPTAIGGGFGGKFVLYDPLVALAARKLNRPVRLALTRGEEMTSATPAPATRVTIRLGARADGTLTLLDGDFVMDSGCFPSSMTGLAVVLFGSLYQSTNVRIRAREVLTHKPSTGAYRAPCAPQIAFALESALDELAGKLGMDPLELRLKNASRPGDPLALRGNWPSMGMREVLEEAGRHPVWLGRHEARTRGRGVGIALGGWPGGTEPAAASCVVERDGTLKVSVGSVDLTGTNTSFAMLAAEAFGLDTDRVRVSGGDTANAPYAGASGGSKTLYTVGPAVIQAAQEARRQTLALASEMLEADAADLEIVNGNVQVKGAPDKAIPIGKIAARTMRFGGYHAPIFGHGRHANNIPSPGFCAQIAEVEVDQETGTVKVHKLIVIQDVGRAINPAAVQGQMMGGATQGLGWALTEALVENAGQHLTASFMDYALPHFHQTPEQFEAILVEVPSDLGPFGARGVGEPPAIPTAGAIANAIADAVKVHSTQLPITPPTLRRALDELSQRGA